MITLRPLYRLVSGTSYRRVQLVTLPAGTFDVDCVLGSPGAVSTATALVRLTSDSSTVATLSSAANPARLAAQRFTLVSEAEVEVVVANSSASIGLAMVDSIRISDAPLQLWKNNITTRLATQLEIGATSMVLRDGAGTAITLSPTGGQFFLVCLKSSSFLEVVRCTARTGDTLTITRAQEGTTARVWTVSGTQVIIAETAATLTSLQAKL